MPSSGLRLAKALDRFPCQACRGGLARILDERVERVRAFGRDDLHGAGDGHPENHVLFLIGPAVLLQPRPLRSLKRLQIGQRHSLKCLRREPPRRHV